MRVSLRETPLEMVTRKVNVKYLQSPQLLFAIFNLCDSLPSFYPYFLRLLIGANAILTQLTNSPNFQMSSLFSR